MELLVGILLGTLFGLLLRPILNSWLAWRYVLHTRRHDEVRARDLDLLLQLDG